MNKEIELPSQSDELPELQNLEVGDLLAMSVDERKNFFDRTMAAIEEEQEQAAKKPIPREEKLRIWFNNPKGNFSLSQIQELWKRREELDEETFRWMIESIIVVDVNKLTDPSGTQDENGAFALNCERTGPRFPGICPFTGLPADTVIFGHYGSTWLDLDSIDINHSITKDLLELAQRVGAGVEALEIVDGVRSQFHTLVAVTEDGLNIWYEKYN